MGQTASVRVVGVIKAWALEVLCFDSVWWVNLNGVHVCTCEHRLTKACIIMYGSLLILNHLQVLIVTCTPLSSPIFRLCLGLVTILFDAILDTLFLCVRLAITVIHVSYDSVSSHGFLEDVCADSLVSILSIRSHGYRLN